MSHRLPRIERPYLLICPIPHYRHPDGSIWLDPLWHRDLVRHFTYLDRLTLLSPLSPWSEDLELVRLDPPDDIEFELVAIPHSDSLARALAKLPAVVRILWRTIGRVDIVHSGIAGWPIPPGWLANPIALLRGKILLINVESAFWRVPEGRAAGLKDRLREAVSEALGRFFVNRADVSFFSHPSYRASLLTTSGREGYITPASWITEEDIASAEEVRAGWDAKRVASPVRLLFAGRLVPEKGIDVLLEAIDRLDRRGVALRVDVIGEGPRGPACLAAAARMHSVEMSVLAPVPYGRPFFELLRQYHALVLPSLSDEQPRIIFDAFAQAVPVLASRTDGIAPHVIEGETGHLFEKADVHALEASLERAAGDPAELERLGLTAHAAADELTHEHLHRTRWRVLVEKFGASDTAAHSDRS